MKLFTEVREICERRLDEYEQRKVLDLFDEFSRTYRVIGFVGGFIMGLAMGVGMMVLAQMFE